MCMEARVPAIYQSTYWIQLARDLNWQGVCLVIAQRGGCHQENANGMSTLYVLTASIYHACGGSVTKVEVM